MIYGSVCSGIEAATAAWDPLNWNPSFFSEIEEAPRKVLKHHYPNVPLHGDFTTIQKDMYEPIDLLVGGTPCQSFSVAGLREGLDDPRGNLMLEFGALAKRLQPEWLVWENVPGVLSSNGGKDFRAFLTMLAQLGYGFAYRILDAQHFGVPQRRRRVFVVAHFRDYRRSAAVLFERESLQGDTKKSRKTGKEVTEIIGTISANCGGLNRPAGNANELDFCITHTCSGKDKFGTLLANCGSKQWLGNQEALSGDYHVFAVYQSNMKVRRLMPIECERLQGFSDNYTNVAGLSDSARYKMLGNSMAVPVMNWIGKRIELVNTLGIN